MEILASHGFILLALACAFGLFMAWGIGANDVANAMGTSVGSRALTLKQAILVAAIFEFAGAYLAGGEVTSTIRKGIIDPAVLTDSPELLVFGMLSALLAAATWLLIASMRGWPVSTTHSIVGAIVGFAAVGISVEAVAWGKVGTIAASWVVSPLLAGSMSFALFISVKNLILDHENTFERARRYVPMYMWMVGFMISMVTLLKGLKHIGIDFDLGMGSKFTNAMVVSAAVGLVVAASYQGRWRYQQWRERGESFWHFDDIHRLRYGIRPRIKRCGERSGALGSSGEHCAVGWGYWCEIGHALVGAGHWCGRDRGGPGNLRVESHSDHWQKNYRAHAQSRFCRRAGSRFHSGVGFCNRAAYFYNPYAGGCCAGRRSGARC